ncbi:MAG: hypothetical protein RhofKO_01250 [Rhodothermales bacterium]
MQVFRIGILLWIVSVGIGPVLAQSQHQNRVEYDDPVDPVLQAPNLGQGEARLGQSEVINFPDDPYWELATLTGVEVSAVLATPTGTLLAGQERNRGLYRSTDDGVSWTLVPLSTWFMTFAADAQGHIYGGTIWDGVWKSTDDGQSWTQLKLVPNQFTSITINDIAIDANGIIYAVGIQGMLYRSTNGGDTWTAVQVYSNPFADVLSIHVVGTETLLAGTEHGIYRSSNGGLSWQLVSANTIHITDIDRKSDGTLYALATAVERGLYLSRDEGQTWARETSGTYGNALLISAEDQLFVGDNSGVKGRFTQAIAWLLLEEGYDGLTDQFGYAGRRVNDFALDAEGYLWVATDCCVQKSIRPAESLLKAPLPIAPTRDQTNLPLGRMRLLWQSVVETTYQVEIALDEMFKQPAAYTVVQGPRVGSTIRSGDAYVANVDQEIEGLGPGETYYWRVYDETTGFYSLIRRFTTESALVVPALVSPRSGAVDVHPGDTLQWALPVPVADPVVYRVQVAQDIGFRDLVVDQEGVQGTELVLPSLAYGQRYFWRVQTTSATSVSAWSPSYSFHTALPAPQSVAPETGEVNVDVQPTLQWALLVPVADPVTYRVQVALDIGFQDLVVDQEGVQGTELAVSNLAYGQRYYWRVQTTSAVSMSAWSLSYSFYTVLPTPQSVAPETGEVNVDVQPTLSWSGGGIGWTYDVQLDTTAMFMQPATFTAADTSLSLTAPLQANTPYYWRVRSTDGPRTSAWTEALAFTTRLASVVLHAPADRVQELPVQLQWFAVAGAQQYEVRLGLDTTHVGGLPVVAVLADTTYLAEGLSYTTQYFWQVQAQGSRSTSVSAIRSFETGIEPLALAVPLEPGNGASGVSGRVTFAWEGVSRAKAYDLHVSTDSLFNTLVVEQTQVADTVVSDLILPYGTTYFWRVRPMDEDGPGAWFNPARFTTAIGVQVDEEGPQFPTKLQLYPNYPNPFTHRTTISFALPQPTYVRVSVYDLLGRRVEEVLSAPMPPGVHTIWFDAKALSPGVYYCRLSTAIGEHVQTMVVR